MSKQIITVVGSTGNIGHEIINLLSQSEVSVRAVLRNFKKARPMKGVTWIQADLQDKEILDAVIAGTNQLFLLTGNTSGFSQTQIQIIETAEKLGVQHVVKLSALGASPKTKSALAHEHWLVEEALKNTSMTWTILRPHVFMQNWLGEVAQTVKADQTIYAAIGEGKVPFIDVRDIAAVAVEALLNAKNHVAKTYVLTGDEAIGYQALAQAISKATGKDIKYKALSMVEMRARMLQQGVPTQMIDSYLALAAYQKEGGATERVSESVRTVLQRPAKTVEEFAIYYKDHFMN